ncbi:HAD family hydrolase [Hahella sp. CCB-MM4]|uniref:HAD family hydrolase n=1 Tax=Hahella sp. (strain CCB-MM4) TaxID=1926491 RepID=UPI000B9BCA2F|nr:HAD-IA family hydrolase [Hahella sp. CCB-MM4]OZG74581.1 HAD family hydrolase [Hahella sp. CCB-MM4]
MPEPSIDQLSLPTPRVILFDWHGTLVDTLDAMYKTMEEMLPQLEELNLVQQLIPEELCRTPDDVKLVRYIRIFRKLHPKILAERRISRTEIFNAIFGDNTEAKRIAHQAYNRCYRHHYGDVTPFQGGLYDYLCTLHKLGIKLAIATNRSREFLDHELDLVEDGRWKPLFDTTVCADDVTEYKPAPDVIHQALTNLGEPVSPHVWYVGDSHTDMLTAYIAGITPVFYNGAHWEERWIDRIIANKEHNPEAPRLVVDSFEQLMDTLEFLQDQKGAAFEIQLRNHRPPAWPPKAPPPQRIEPDWHPNAYRIPPPNLILFDWHATLVDTLDAMYHAVDDMLPLLEKLNLIQRLIKPEQSKTPEDARLVEHVRHYQQLHPKVKADRKISRTDIFEVLFGEDQEAKRIAHNAFNEHYRNHYGTVLPFEPQVRLMLEGLRSIKLKIGVITNRDREFFVHELAAVEGSGWSHLFDVDICGDDTAQRKPHPDQIFLAANKLGLEIDKSIWYVGDSTTDTIAAKSAGITSVFFNGAQWDLTWLQKIFPGTERFPHKPDVVVNDFSEFWALILACYRG